MRILIVEDEPKLAGSLEEGLLNAQYAVDVAADGEEALAFASTTTYDVIVLDVLLPGIDGLEVCQRLRDQGVRAPVLMLTALDGVRDRVKGLDSGADDYLVKPFALEELLARIRALLRRDSERKDPVIRAGELTLDPASQIVKWGDAPVECTSREYRIIEVLIRKCGWVVSREAIIECVWGFDYPDSSNLIEVYLGRIRKKLQEHGAPAVIQTVRGEGYRLQESVA